MTDYLYATSGEAVGFLRGRYVHALDGRAVGQLRGPHVHRLTVQRLLLATLTCAGFVGPRFTAEVLSRACLSRFGRGHLYAPNVSISQFAPPPRLALLAPFKRGTSGSAAFLGLASDGQQYWVKAPRNPQGSRTLVAEMIAYGLGRLIGAPVPTNALIEIPVDFDWEYADAYRLRGGTGHGSLNLEGVVVAEEWGTYSRLDDNRRRQALILAMWDLCMGVDPQWLHQTTEEYSIWSFDHGFWLAGESDWTIDSLQRIGTSSWQFELDPGVASASGLREAADRVDDLTLASITSLTHSVPLEWETTSRELSELAAILFLRTEGVAERLRTAANQSRHS